MARTDQKVECPKCGSYIEPGAKTCRPCFMEVQLYAQELGIKPRVIYQLGGVTKLRALSPECRAILLRSNPGNSRSLVRGGLAARKMFKRVPGRITTSSEEYAA